MTEFAGFIKQLSIVSFTAKAIQAYRQFKALKLTVGKKDLCIAAIARELNATVVTSNLSDFGRVRGLAVEDWSK